MTDVQGFHLYVNLSASQARRRLKKFGHGVRQIQSVGKNRSLIIHTATGEHRSELEQKFADVGYSRSEADLGAPIENLRNVGPSRARDLRAVGISTIDELQRLGPVKAFRRLQQQSPAQKIDVLWSMAAGLKGLDASALSDEQKNILLTELRNET